MAALGRWQHSALKGGDGVKGLGGGCADFQFCAHSDTSISISTYSKQSRSGIFSSLCGSLGTQPLNTGLAGAVLWQALMRVNRPVCPPASGVVSVGRHCCWKIKDRERAMAASTALSRNRTQVSQDFEDPLHRWPDAMIIHLFHLPQRPSE